MNCSSDGCTEHVVYTTSGLCARCYRRAWAAARRPPPKARPTLEDRFWSKVNKGGPTQSHMDTPCWVWTGALRSDGYGVINAESAGRGVLRAHRFSYELHHGPQDQSLFVLHECDNPPCVNPAHLHAGTNAENMREMGDRKRSKFHKARFLGETHGMSKLTADKVRAMRIRRSEGATFAQLSAEFGVTASNAHMVISGQTWGHVT